MKVQRSSQCVQLPHAKLPTTTLTATAPTPISPRWDQRLSLTASFQREKRVDTPSYSRPLPDLQRNIGGTPFRPSRRESVRQVRAGSPFQRTESFVATRL